jgi:hypothetical protein
MVVQSRYLNACKMVSFTDLLAVAILGCLSANNFSSN